MNPNITMDDWIKTFYNPDIRNNIDKGCLSDLKYRTLLYLYHAFDNYLYSDKYKDRILGLQEKFMGLQTQYGEEQFYEHNLIAVDDTRSLLTVNPTRLYDKRLNRTFLMKNISLPLCRILTGTEGINKLSVRLLDSVGVEGKLTKSRKNEELERGYYFDFDVLGRFSVTKLYSVELYYDCLYITVKDADSGVNFIIIQLCSRFWLSRKSRKLTFAILYFRENLEVLILSLLAFEKISKS